MSLFLNALRGQNHSKEIPVWFMRQAGRHLPEYRALRKEYRLEELFTSPEAIVEISQQPLKRYDVDACVVFSDILLPTMALGIDWSYPEGIGPTPSYKIDSAEIIEALPKQIEETSCFDFLFKAITVLKKEISQPIIGLLGGPFTVASYLIETKHSSHLSTTKAFAYHDPGAFKKLLDSLSEAMLLFGKKQVEAGASVLQFFDSWGGLLDPQDFEKYSLHYYQKLREAFDVPVIYFSRGSGNYAKALAKYAPDAVSIDWPTPLAEARETLPLPIALQGNLDPALLLAPKEILCARAEKICFEMRDDPGYIFNLGHGILPQTDPYLVEKLLETIRNPALV